MFSNNCHNKNGAVTLRLSVHILYINLYFTQRLKIRHLTRSRDSSLI